MNNKLNNRSNYQGYHILTNDFSSSTDTWETGLNNNVLVFGPSGSGKTRHYVRPNVLTSHESMIISDTKGSLHKEIGPALEKRGFRVLNIDFTDLTKGAGYNPLAYIRYDEDKALYNEKDIFSLTYCLVPETNEKDPFWHFAARQYLFCIISYVMNMLPEQTHTLDCVTNFLPEMNNGSFRIMMNDLDTAHPGNTASLKYRSFESNGIAERMHASIIGVLSESLNSLLFNEAIALYHKPGMIDFASLGVRKTALFLTISDTDRSMDRLANAFMTQALQILCRSADKDHPDHMLPIPVRLYLDDFATNLYIPDFDKIISVIRSREISVSVILQNITQLDTLYGHPAARTIMNNCDSQLYLGGQDPETAEYISVRTNKPIESILAMPLEKAWLLRRGSRCDLSEKYDTRTQEHSLADSGKAGPKEAESSLGRRTIAFHWPTLPETTSAAMEDTACMTGMPYETAGTFPHPAD